MTEPDFTRVMISRTHRRHPANPLEPVSLATALNCIAVTDNGEHDPVEAAELLLADHPFDTSIICYQRVRPTTYDYHPDSP